MNYDEIIKALKCIPNASAVTFLENSPRYEVMWIARRLDIPLNNYNSRGTASIPKSVTDLINEIVSEINLDK